MIGGSIPLPILRAFPHLWAEFVKRIGHGIPEQEAREQTKRDGVLQQAAKRTRKKLQKELDRKDKELPKRG